MTKRPYPSWSAMSGHGSDSSWQAGSTTWRFKVRFEFEWLWWPEVGSRISDSFGYLQRSLQGLFVGVYQLRVVVASSGSGSLQTATVRYLQIVGICRVRQIIRFWFLVRLGCRDRSGSGRCIYSCKTFRLVGVGSSGSCRRFYIVRGDSKER